MAVAFITGQLTFDDTTPFGGTTQCALAFPVAATVGNTIVVVLGMASNLTITGIADDGGNTYTVMENLEVSLNEAWVYTAPVTSAATTITITLSATTNAQGLVAILEFSGLNNADLLEDTSTASHVASPYDSGSVTTTVDDSLLVGVIIGSPGTYTQDADSWVTIRNWVGGCPAYKIRTTTATESWTVTSSEAETATQIVVALNGAGGGGGGGSTQNLFYRRRR